MVSKQIEDTKKAALRPAEIESLNEYTKRLDNFVDTLESKRKLGGVSGAISRATGIDEGYHKSYAGILETLKYSVTDLKNSLAEIDKLKKNLVEAKTDSQREVVLGRIKKTATHIAALVEITIPGQIGIAQNTLKDRAGGAADASILAMDVGVGLASLFLGPGAAIALVEKQGAKMAAMSVLRNALIGAALGGGIGAAATYLKIDAMKNVPGEQQAPLKDIITAAVVYSAVGAAVAGGLGMAYEIGSRMQPIAAWAKSRIPQVLANERGYIRVSEYTKFPKYLIGEKELTVGEMAHYAAHGEDGKFAMKCLDRLIKIKDPKGIDLVAEIDNIANYSSHPDVAAKARKFYIRE